MKDLNLANSTPVVNSFNEWDPLEEIIVGVVDGATVPTWHVTLQATMPADQREFYLQNGGQPFPKEQVEAASKELDEFARLLEGEGVRVRWPDRLDHAKRFATPDWQSCGGMYAAMPRDALLVVGNEIIEAPMAWRSRYFESLAYRSLLKEYFHRGAKWTAAPKPQLSDTFYNYDYREPLDGEPLEYVISEFEPTFDAADFIRCGRDIFVQRSHVTNRFGIEWLQRHLGELYTIHELTFDDMHAMHIDATILPLAPGKLLANPERVKQVPAIFKGWDILWAPRPCLPDRHPLYMTSKWINMNILSLDQERIIVEKGEETIIKSLKDWGFKPIPCAFRNFNSFGGSFHCATLDVRRRGRLESYF